MPIKKSFCICSWTLLLFISILMTGCGFGEQGSSVNSINSPQGLIAVSGSRAVELSWNGVPSATSYSVYWSTDKNVKRDAAGQVKTEKPYFMHQGLANGLKYYYIVSAHTGAGESATSIEVSGLPEEAAPADLQNVYFRSGDERVTINFGLTPGATHYSVYWSREAIEDDYESANRIDGVLSPFVHSGLTNGTPYFYRILASNALGKSTVTKQYVVSPQQALPMAPVITEAIFNENTITLTWVNTSNADSFDLVWRENDNIDGKDSVISTVVSPYIFSLEQQNTSGNLNLKLRAKNSAGVSNYSNVVLFNVPNIVSVSTSENAPDMPSLTGDDGRSLVTVDIADRQLTLNWTENNNDGKARYNIYWKKGSSVLDYEVDVSKENFDQKIINIQPPYTHIALQNYQYYYYRISKINDGGESALSILPPIIGRPEVVKPGIPSGVSATSGDSKIIVSWNAVQRADFYNLTLIENSKSIEYPNVQSPIELSALTNGIVYQVQVRAISGNKISDASAIIESTPSEPVSNAPEVLTASPGNQQITLQWVSAQPKNIDDENEAVTTYRVYYRTRSGVSPNNASMIDDVEIVRLNETNIWQATVPNLSNGQRYFFVVTAVNAGGESQVSPQAWAIPQELIPNAPSQVFAKAGDNQITIYFSGIGDDNSPVYNLYWSKETRSGRSQTQVITNIAQSPAYVFTDGESNGQNYFFQVSATNLGGESVLSAEVSATPQILKPTAVPANISVVTTSKTANITWDNVTSATDYFVYWSTNSKVIAGNRTKERVTDGTVGFKQEKLISGQNYYYRLAAINAGGEGPLSDIFIAQPKVDPPVTPSGLTAIADDSNIKLGWTVDTTAANTLSYDLYWNDELTAPLSQWRLVRGVLTGHVVSKLVNGRTYHFKIIAINSGGKSKLSNVVSTTPLKPAIEIPAIPTGLVATSGDTELFLKWNTKPSLNYTIYWSTESNKPFENGFREDNVKSTWTHGKLSPLTNDQLYYYQITATNEGGESLPSESVSATPIKIFVNSQPKFPAVANRSSDEGETITPFSVRAQDSNIADVLVYTAAGYPAGIIFDEETVEFSGSLTSDSSQPTPYNVTVTVDDQSGGINPTATLNFNWQVYKVVTVPSQSTVTIQPTNNVVVGEPISLLITARDRKGIQRIVGGETVTFSIMGANQNIVAPTVTDNSDGTYEVSYIPLNQGQDGYVIQINGQAIGGGPYSKTVFPPTFVLNKTTMTATSGQFTAGDTVEFTAQLFDKDNVVTTAPSVVFNIVGVNNQNIAGVYNSTTQIYEASFQTAKAGSDSYTVSVDGTTVSALSFTGTTAVGALDISKTLLTVIPINQKITTDETIEITVSTQDAYGNSVYDDANVISIILPYANKALVLPAITDNNDGTYSLSYQPEKISTEYINLDVNSGEFTNYVYKNIVGGTPVLSTLEVNIPSGPFSVLHNYALSAGLKDQFDNSTTANAVFNISGSNPQSLTTSFRYDSNTASYANIANFNPAQLGSDTITLSIDGLDIATISETRVIGPNRIPIASAGADFIASRGTTIQLNANHSIDPENQPVTATWVFVSKPANSAATLDDLISNTPSFLADELGIYTFSLAVKDGFDASKNTAKLNVIVKDPHKLDAPNTSAIPNDIATIVSNDNGDLVAIWQMYNGRSSKQMVSHKPVNGQWSVEELIVENSNKIKLATDGSTFMIVYDKSYQTYSQEFNGTAWDTPILAGSYYYGGFELRILDGEYFLYGVQSYSSLVMSTYQLNTVSGIWEWIEMQNIQVDSASYINGIPTFGEDNSGRRMFAWVQRRYQTDIKANIYELVSVVFDGSDWLTPEIIVSQTVYNMPFKQLEMNSGFLLTWYTSRQELINTVMTTVYDINAIIYSSGAWGNIELIYTSQNPNYEVATNGDSLKIVWGENIPANINSYDLNIRGADLNTQNDVWTWNSVQALESSQYSISAPKIISNGSNYLLSWSQRDLAAGFTNQMASIFDPIKQLWGTSVNIESTDQHVFGTVSLATNNDGYLVIWNQYGLSSTQEIFGNVYEINQATSAYSWKGAEPFSNTGNFNSYSVSIVSNGVGYAVNWYQNVYLNGGYEYTDFIKIYGKSGTSNSWGATQQLEVAGIRTRYTSNLDRTIALPSGEYQTSWIEVIDFKNTLYTSSVNNVDTIVGTNLVQDIHEGSVIDVKTAKNDLGSTLVVSRQYHDGNYQLYGQLYRNETWESQFLIENRNLLFEVETIGSNFFIIYDSHILNNTNNRNISAVILNETLGLGTATQLNLTPFTNGSYFTWEVSVNQSNLAVIWGGSNLFSSVYDSNLGVWSPEETLLTNSTYVYSVDIATDGVGFGVTWVSYDSASYSGYANIYSAGNWTGEALIESNADAVGSYYYNGAPVIASNGSTYAVIWAQNNADDTTSRIMTNTFNLSTSLWGTPLKIGDAGRYQTYFSIVGNDVGYAANWNKNVLDAIDNGPYESFYQLDPTLGTYSWVTSDRLNCALNSEVSLNRFVNNCQNKIYFRILNDQTNAWSWEVQPDYPPANNFYNITINETGRYAGLTSRYSYTLRKTEYLFASYDLINGWDTARNLMLPSTTNNYQGTISTTGDGFAYHWFEFNAVDTTLQNAWIMPNL